jgi:hypothetical protein
VRWLVVALLCAGCTPKPPEQTWTLAEKALSMQCERLGGLTAFAHGPQGEWVACYRSNKRLWHVKII